MFLLDIGEHPSESGCIWRALGKRGSAVGIAAASARAAAIAADAKSGRKKADNSTPKFPE